MIVTLKTSIKSALTISQALGVLQEDGTLRLEYAADIPKGDKTVSGYTVDTGRIKRRKGESLLIVSYFNYMGSQPIFHVKEFNNKAKGGFTTTLPEISVSSKSRALNTLGQVCGLVLAPCTKPSLELPQNKVEFELVEDRVEEFSKQVKTVVPTKLRQAVMSFAEVRTNYWREPAPSPQEV
jgi:hypothetical protein